MIVAFNEKITALTQKNLLRITKTVGLLPRREIKNQL